MTSTAVYRTKQRELLLEYLETVPGIHITAGDACAYFRSHGADIGQSTVYRQLEKLVDEGLVIKYTVDGNTPACFEYTGGDVHTDAGTCFHCKCEKCGRLIHLHCDALEEVQHHLLSGHGFRMNPIRTVIYGLCEDCAKAAPDMP